VKGCSDFLCGTTLCGITLPYVQPNEYDREGVRPVSAPALIGRE
jgi:hypothetical protein